MNDTMALMIVEYLNVFVSVLLKDKSSLNYGFVYTQE
jgi:hypothetical protein